MNAEQTHENIFMYIKTHFSETIEAKTQDLGKTMIKYSSYILYISLVYLTSHI